VRVVVQRVSSASVEVEGEVVGEISKGLMILLGVSRGDEEEQARWLARKILSLRIFPDEAGKMNRSLLESGGAALVVSQFTLYGDCRKGRRPSFVEAAGPERAQELYIFFCDCLRELGCSVATGIFRASMSVSLVNEGPVSLIIDSP